MAFTTHMKKYLNFELQRQTHFNIGAEIWGSDLTMKIFVCMSSGTNDKKKNIFVLKKIFGL